MTINTIVPTIAVYLSVKWGPFPVVVWVVPTPQCVGLPEEYPDANDGKAYVWLTTDSTQIRARWFDNALKPGKDYV